MKEQSSLLFGICHKSWAYVILFLLALCLSAGVPSRVVAQSMLADFTGQITDASGAGIPGAKVNLINEGTQGRRSATTDDTGIFRIDGLLVGTYTFEVEKEGFKKFSQIGIALAPTQLKRVDAVLEVGRVTETVQVTAVVPVIQTEAPAITTGIPKQLYTDKPMYRGQYNEFPFDSIGWAPGSSSGNSDMTFMGNRSSMTQTSVEGMQMWWQYNREPSTAISELNLILSNAPAEYARPVTADATYRSGSNRLTGEWREDFYNTCTYARDNPFSNLPASSYTCPTKWYHMFTAAGPVVIPKVYNGRNKTFFFWTLQLDQTKSTDDPAQAQAPTALMQAGNFSQYKTSSGTLIPIIDPSTGQPFPGNIIPTNRISQMAPAVWAQYYKNYTPLPGVDPNFYAGYNSIRHSTYVNPIRLWVIKIDHNLGDKDILSGSYTSAYHSDHFASWGGGDHPATYGLQRAVNGPIVSFAETHTFSPSVVNQLRLGVARYTAPYRVTDANPDMAAPVVYKYGADDVTAMGIQGLAPSNRQGATGVNISNWLQAGAVQASDRVDTRYQGFDNLSIQKGRHAIKMGFSAVKLLEDGTVSGPTFGNFDFNGMFSGNSLVDFELGLPSTFQRYVPRPTVARRMWEYAAFLQDDFKVSPKLSLSYGLRWDKYTVPYDKNGLYYNFDPQTMSIVVPNQFAKDHVSPFWPTATFPIKLASEAGYPSKLTNGTMNFLPRLGFAYYFAKDTVLRGGYGMYTGFERFASLQTTGPFALTEAFTNEPSTTTGTGALYSLPAPFGGTGAVASVLSATGYSKDYRVPYSQNWNLTLEHRIAGNWGLRASYIGVKMTQAPWGRNLNTPTISTIPYTAARKPFPALGAINFVENGTNDRYNALSLQVTHPWIAGLYFTGNYTYSRSWGEGPTGKYDKYEIDQTAWYPEYPYDRARSAHRSDAQPTHDFISNFSWDVPVGNGKRLATHANKVVNTLIGNWSFVGVFSWRSGVFYSPYLSGVDPGNIGVTSNRAPNLVAGCDPNAGQDKSGTHQWYNPACFTAPPNGELGNVRPFSLDGPSAWIVNGSPFKDFPLNSVREGMKLRFSASIFNLFNHPAYDRPDTSLSSATAGKITWITSARQLTTNQGMRNMIFSLRLMF